MSGQEDASDTLLRRVSEAKTQLAVTRAQRGVVTAACNYCRVKKVKCDAQRPCSTCVKRNLDCHYETSGSETHSQASKRKHDELSRSHDTHAQLFQLLATCTGPKAAEIYRRIRMGDSPDDIVARYTDADHGHVPLPVKRAARQLFLVTLAHSTGSILDIVKLAMRAFDPIADLQLPDSSELLLLRNRIAYIHRIEAIVQRSSGVPASLPAPSANSSAQRPETTFYAGLDTRTDRDNYALHQVPASPWVVITDDDEAISHLVSLFLAWINPGWRFVEQDLFLQGMRSGDVRSQFCSPFLVNAMCSMACIHSEHDIAFIGGDRDRFTRGQHFHNQALRLWSLEQNRATVSNIQALCMLSFDSNYRAKDNQGLGLIPMVIQMDNELPLQRDLEWCARRGISERDYARARLAAHWTAICLHINMRLSYMHDMTVRPSLSHVPKIHNVFQDDVDLWIGYTLSREAVPHRSTLYLREKCALAILFHEMHSLIFADKHKKTNAREFVDKIDQFSTQMESWHERLPFELQYDWPMCVAVWELHASYTCFCMSLRLVARNRCLQDGEGVRDRSHSPDSPHPEYVTARMAHDNLSKARSLAYKAAQMLREFRERYGLKISPPWLVQLSAVAASVLVLDKDLTMPYMESDSSEDHPRRPITDSHAAFDDVFRCLLGTGVEIFIARGMARMIYHIALEQKIVLSRPSRAMLQIMADTAWRPSDLSLMQSAYPDITTVSGDEEGDANRRLTDLLTSWEKMEI